MSRPTNEQMAARWSRRMRCTYDFRRFASWLLGFFWAPCPLCGREFGGYEWLSGELVSTIPTPSKGPGTGTAICPVCTYEGRGYKGRGYK